MDKLNVGPETQPLRKKNIHLSIKDFLLIQGMIVLLCFSGASIWANRQLAIKLNKLEGDNAEIIKKINSLDFEQQSRIDDLEGKIDELKLEIVGLEP